MKIEEDADLKKIKSHPEEWQKEVDHIEVDVQPSYGILDFSRFKKLNFIKENLQNNFYNENFRLSNKVIISQRIISDDVSDINTDSGYDPILNYRYNPGEVDLFKEVINIKLTPSSILNFVNKFGLLESDYIYKKQSYRNYMQNGSNMITVFSHNIITPLVEDYDVFINNVKKIKSLYALWLDFKADKLKIEELKQYIISLAPENIKDIEKINSDNYKDLFFNLFRIELNINLHKLYITPHLIAGAENSFLPGYTYSNLFNLVYIQFY